jgi:ATP-binding cassette subfamily B protein
LDLPYQVFEDQRSGETLGKLQKVRSDVERFITAAINILFISVVGIVFVMIYAFRVHWSIAPAFLVTVPLLGIISSVLSKRIKKMQRRSLPKPPPWPVRPRSHCAISNWSRVSVSRIRKWSG